MKGARQQDVAESHYGPRMAHCGDPVVRQNISPIWMVVIFGGARVCRGAWRYAPLPQREVGNLALLRRSRIFSRVAASKVWPAPASRRSYTNRHAICLKAGGAAALTLP